jgi:Mg2+ and Co2+ transporter CorA
MRVSALVTAFEMRSARAYVDAFTQLTEEITRRIEEMEQSMQKMMDYMREKARREVYHCINRLNEKSLNEADIRKRYVKLMTAYLGTLLYLTA